MRRMRHCNQRVLGYATQTDTRWTTLRKAYHDMTPAREYGIPPFAALATLSPARARVTAPERIIQKEVR